MKLKSKRTRGRIEVLRALPYKGSMIYIRRIDKELFMYDVVFKGQIYSGHIVAKMKQGQSRMTPKEIHGATVMILAGATTTVDRLLGESSLTENQQRVAEVLEKVAES